LHWVFPLAAVGLLLGLAGRRSQLPLLYLLAAGATALTIGKIGANVNYLLQLWAALSLLAGLAAGYAALPGRTGLAGAAGTLLGGVVAVWLLVGLQQAVHVPYEAGEAGAERRGVAAAILGATRWGQLPLWRLDPWGAGPAALPQRARERYYPTPSGAEAEHARRAAAYVGAVEGDVLAEEMNFTVTTGRRIYLQPFEFSQLAAQGQWDEGPLLEEVRRGAFGVVVLRFRLGDDPFWRRERVNDPLIAALQEAYVLDAVFGDYYLYRYRPETAGDRVW
jgi:hypothetical protein